MSSPAAPETVSIREFKRLDIRIGTITKAECVEGSDKLYKIQADMGDHTRQIVSSLVGYYKPEELEGKVIAVLCNLKPATIFGQQSNGMLLTAEQGGDLALLTIDRLVSNGSKVA